MRRWLTALAFLGLLAVAPSARAAEDRLTWAVHFALAPT